MSIGGPFRLVLAYSLRVYHSENGCPGDNLRKYGRRTKEKSGPISRFPSTSTKRVQDPDPLPPIRSGGTGLESTRKLGSSVCRTDVGHFTDPTESPRNLSLQLIVSLSVPTERTGVTLLCTRVK